MASTAPAPAHIPAWKRLGLQLKNQQQPEEPSHCPKAPTAVQATQEESLERHLLGGVTRSRLPEDGARGRQSPTKVGKRKAEDSILGDDGKPSKKRLKEQSVEQGRERAAPPAVQEKEATFSSTSIAAQDSKPRGDPNYRSRKGKSHDAVPKKRRVSLEGHGLETDAWLNQSNRHGTSLSEVKSRVNSDSDQDTLHQSTETDHHHVTDDKNCSKRSSKLKRTPDIERASIELTPTLTRRKSVTFTPDTKTTDGNSASELFKAWAAQQKGLSADFTPSEVAQFTPPPKIHPANSLPPIEKLNKKDSKKAGKSEKTKKSKLSESTTATGKVVEEPAKASSDEPPKPSKAELKAAKKANTAAATKTESAAYLDYLTRYHTSRETWKFNKATQSNLLRDALNIFRIPAEYSPALKEYITGLQGAAARERLREAATAILKEVGEVDDVKDMEILDDREARKAAHDEALLKRLQHTKRLLDAGQQLPDTAGPEPKKRLTRQRAQEILEALSAGAPAPAPMPIPAPLSAAPAPRPAPVVPYMHAPNAVPKNIVSKGAGTRLVFDDEDLPAPPPKPRARNRKRRTDVSDDDNSSSDDSSDSDSSDSDDDAKQIILNSSTAIDLNDYFSADESDDDEESGSDDSDEDSDETGEEEEDEDEDEVKGEDEDEQKYHYDAEVECRRALAAHAAMQMEQARRNHRPFARPANVLPAGFSAGFPGFPRVKTESKDEVKHDYDTDYERRRLMAVQAAKDMERARNNPRSFSRRAAGFRRNGRY